VKSIAFLCLVFCGLGDLRSAPINDAEFEQAGETKTAALVADNALITLRALFDSLPKVREDLALPAPATVVLDAPTIANRLRESTIAVGYTYFCDDCDAWHLYLSTGFIIADGVACTSLHVFQDAEDGPLKNFPIAMDQHGNVYAITGMLAADADADSCLVRISGADSLPPLPLATDARAGESVYLMSHPDTRYFRFSSGIISRLIYERRPNGAKFPMLDVTAEFAPGSSGGPIVNVYGNVLGHVSTISATPLAEDGSMDDGSAIVERLCSASESLAKMAAAGQNPRISYESPDDE
jgi:S1-C subfamily serine protease